MSKHRNSMNLLSTKNRTSEYASKLGTAFKGSPNGKSRISKGSAYPEYIPENEFEMFENEISPGQIGEQQLQIADES